MAIDLVSGQSSTNSSNNDNLVSIDITLTADVTIGSYIYVGCTSYFATGDFIASVADEGGNTYARVDGGDESDGSCEMWKAEVTGQKGSAGFVITITFNAGEGDYPWCAAAELSGMDTVTAQNGTNNATNSATIDFVAGSVTVLEGGGVIAMMGRDDAANRTIEPITGFVTIEELENGGSSNAGSLIIDYERSAGAIEPGWTIGAESNGSGCCAALNIPSVGGGISVPVAIHHLRQAGGL